MQQCMPWLSITPRREKKTAAALTLEVISSRGALHCGTTAVTLSDYNTFLLHVGGAFDLYFSSPSDDDRGVNKKGCCVVQ